MTKRTRIIRWKATAKWADSGLNLTGGALTLLKALVKISRDTTIKPTFLTASFGIFDDPTDEFIRFAILPIDPSVLPITLGTNAAVDAFVEATEWIDSEVWRAIGTDAGPTGVDEEARSVKLDGVYSQQSVGDGNTWLCAVVNSSTTSSIFFFGDMDYLIEYRQTTYNNDRSEMSQGPHSLGGS